MNKAQTRMSMVLLLTVLLLQIPAIASASEVNAKGVGVAPITGQGESAAKRVSLQLAKRDAVERAIGAEVAAESIPSSELLRVTATTAGRLSFDVISEGREGDVYITEIEAKVEIPDELEKKYPRSEFEETTGYEPLVQPFPGGEVNWRDGYITSTGNARLKGKDAKSEAEARRAARVDAYGVALRIVAGINLSPEETAEARMKKAPALEYKVKGLVRGADIIEEGKKGNSYRVVIKVPLRGIKGVQKAFTDAMNLEGPDSPIKKTQDDNAYTGVIVDARGTGLTPAMLAEIVDEEGNPVYAPDMVDAPSLAKRGSAAYVVGEKSGEEGTKGASIPGRYFVVEALRVETAAAPSALGVSLSVPDLFVGFFRDPVGTIKTIAQAAPRIIIRQGPRPVQAKATASKGPTRSRIVISSKAATTIRQEDSRNNFLRQARVVVITDSMIGGTEGRLRFIPSLVPAQ